MKKIALVSHGCPKNLVDSELILGILAQNGYGITLNEDESDIVIVNTCSFICDAERESIRSILELVDKGKKVIVTGCLAQKHPEELKKEIPELAGIIGTADFGGIVDVIKNIDKKFVSEVSKKPDYIYPENIERQQITMGASSYLKIAEGCSYRCGYCIIPYLRGDYHSRTIENIVAEAKKLVKKGVTEIILIAQDTTSYGIDIYKKPSLPKLLEELNKIEGLGWIRFMYAYPTHLDDELLDAIANLDKVVKYVDIPLQHSHPEVLKLMNRPAFDYRPMIENIRKRITDVSIRTAFIVGYPGETEEHFEHLCNFVRDMKFDRMGVFKYSREKGTPSYMLPNRVPAKIANQRYKKLMEIQQEISAERNKKFIGKTIPCIIECFADDGEIIARTQYDAPEIDGIVNIQTDKMAVPGDIEMVKITSASEYDLIGEI
ncbi:TPA: 30S ribosomal protein S12 methylthiotransferase RimO [Candidatus Gastranaerophilales bacterium HUM_5]|nr:MAG TPA: 30S ribosomal protein S12 methylthiotransferase RimO [Candidatus Gastranaerophilales bacterium HUM_4]DAA90523.1 MAG TPA: 30S ribosomal protein S12 methylthiotransferase RimO [Candidatus Gastranaerophilales bacterium HUM_5]